MSDDLKPAGNKPSALGELGGGMSTPTGSLLVLDAGDLLIVTRTFNAHYRRPDLGELAHVDVRRAWALALTAHAELTITIRRLEDELGYTRADRNPETGEPSPCESSPSSPSPSSP
jgi:hypothetical protein